MAPRSWSATSGWCRFPPLTDCGSSQRDVVPRPVDLSSTRSPVMSRFPIAASASTWALALIACLALTAPHRLQAQRASASVGVVRRQEGTRLVPIESSLRRPGSDAPQGNHASRLMLGGAIGAIAGAVVTVAIVRNCEAHDKSHGEAPSCGIAIPTIGPAAMLVGAALGVIIADR